MVEDINTGDEGRGLAVGGWDLDELFAGDDKVDVRL